MPISQTSPPTPSPPSSRTSEKSSLFRAPSSMFWAGFIIRVLYITIVHTYRIRPEEDHLQFGWEMGRIARALATGFGYADPFTGHSGPTAWSPPLYPLLIAGVFKIFGVYTAASAWVLLVINSIFSAATSSVIYEIAARCFHQTGRARKIALWSGWLWALYPAAMQFAVRWIWDMCLTAFLLSKIIVIALRVRGVGEENPSAGAAPQTQTTTRWAAFGLLSGLVVLLNSTLLLFLPVCGLWMLLGAFRAKAPILPTLLRGALACVLTLACIAPWIVRNYTVFHAFIPMRGNLGAEFHQSILEEHQGFPWGATIPVCEVCPVFQQYRQMGEAAYVRREGELAKQEIRAHKLRLVEYGLKRFYFFWVSVPKPAEHGVLNEAVREMNYFFLSLASLLGLALALKQRIPGAVLFAWAFALVPLTYYFITVQARFRHPLEPIMTILTVFLFQSATKQQNPYYRTDMTHVLVTGGSGFFGGILKRRLLAEGYACTNIDLVADPDTHPNLTSVQGDIRDAALLHQIFATQTFAAVFHCAAQLAHDAIDDNLLWTSNVDGTRNLAEAAKQSGVKKIVFISSNCLWASDLGHDVAEDEPPNPIELYGRSKLAGEQVLAAYAHDLDIITIRCPTIIDSGRLGLLAILFEFIDDGKKVWVVGDGSNRYQFIYAQDLATACLQALAYKGSNLFHIGSENVVSLRKVYEAVIRAAGSRSRVASLPKGPTIATMQLAHKLNLSPLGPYHYRMIAESFVFDTTRIRTQLGWTPTVTNEEMMVRAYRYYAENRNEIHARTDVSAHSRPTSMGIIRMLKWFS